MEHKVDAAHYSVSEVLRDGSSIEIRALKPGDHDELLSAVERMSDEQLDGWIDRLLDAMESHERREWLRRDGKPVNDPHRKDEG